MGSVVEVVVGGSVFMVVDVVELPGSPGTIVVVVVVLVVWAGSSAVKQPSGTGAAWATKRPGSSRRSVPPNRRH